MKTKRIIKRPDTWMKITGIWVMDPDGWRNEGIPWSRKITEKRFRQLCRPSTCSLPGRYRGKIRLKEMIKAKISG